MPDSFRSEALAASLLPLVAGRRVLLARADRGRVVLRDMLAKAAHVEQIAVYRNADAPALPVDVATRLAEGSVDWITLTSSAITECLHALLPDSARAAIARGTIRLASLSPVTTEAASRLGWPIAAEATEYNWPGLVDAISRAVQRDRPSVPSRLDNPTGSP